MPQSELLAILHGRARMRPDEVAFGFTDYSEDTGGVRHTLTWSQLSRWTTSVAREICSRGSVGDRVAVLAPQGLEYIVAFLGALQAGRIAVPLPLPHRGSADERIGAVIADTSPSAVVTTSAAREELAEHLGRTQTDPGLRIMTVDEVDLDAAGTGSAPTDLPELPDIAYLQYSSGSTRTPTGVMISHRNLAANFDQLMRDYFRDIKVPPDTTIVSWLPFYHDMGLMLGICAPILGGYRGELSDPIAFLERPARWMRALAENRFAWSSAPNFAFDLSVGKTTDADLDGLDLGGVLGIISGAERVEPATLRRFVNRFAHFGFTDRMLRPSYGLAEATVFVAAASWTESSGTDHFDLDELSAGRIRRCPRGAGAELVKYRVPGSPRVLIVDAQNGRRCPEDRVGEIWVHGDNVAKGYWGQPPELQSCFGAQLTDPDPGTPAGSWLRTGDLGFISAGELFIVGRIKDVLIIRGRNYYPEDIESTVREITRGRVAAIALRAESTEQLVTIAELKKHPSSDGPPADWLTEVKNDITSAVSHAHGLSIGDLVLVEPGSIPTTTSGKIRRSACIDGYRQRRFSRLEG